jgi:hypothetical protein
MNEIPGNPFEGRAAPLSPDTRQLVEDFIARMERIQAEQTQALLIAASEAAVGGTVEEALPGPHRFRGVFPPVFRGSFFRRTPHPRPPQPPAPEEDTTVIIDAPYRVIDGKE